MSRPRGLPKTGGRVKGVPAKVELIRQQFYDALCELGGTPFIVKTAKRYPIQFLQIVSKIIPRQIEADMYANIAIGKIPDEINELMVEITECVDEK